MTHEAINSITSLPSAPALEISADARKKQERVDLLAVVYHCLLDATTVSSNNACIQTKVMENNAAAQRSLNRREASLKLEDAPSLQVNRYSHQTKHNHWVRETRPWRRWFGRHHWVNEATYTTKRWATYKGQTQINLAQEHNKETQGERDGLTQKMVLLQQHAEVNETNVSTENSNASQTSQQMTGLLDMMENLTNKVLMHRGG